MGKERKMGLSWRVYQGAFQTWLAVIGPDISPASKIKDRQQSFQQQIALTIANLLEDEFIQADITPAIVLK